MQPFKLKKDELMSVIEENRDSHREVYLKAMDGYQKAAAEFFEEQLGKARKKQPFVTYFNEPVPEDHTEDYDVLIDALTMTQDDVIELTMPEVRQYVRDEWGWKKEFLATSQNYLAS